MTHVSHHSNGVSRVPAEYTRCALRSVTPACPDTEVIGIGFDTQIGPVRVCLTVDDAEKLQVMLRDTIRHHVASKAPLYEVRLYDRGDGKLWVASDFQGAWHCSYSPVDADSTDEVVKRVRLELHELRERAAKLAAVNPEGSP